MFRLPAGPSTFWFAESWISLPARFPHGTSVIARMARRESILYRFTGLKLVKLIVKFLSEYLLPKQIPIPCLSQARSGTQRSKNTRSRTSPQGHEPSSRLDRREK